jgi:hypothetical protein
MPKKEIEYKVNKKGCHICISHSRDRGGYARINYNGKKIGIHKMLYLLLHGEDSIPDSYVLLHSCDNPNCINVEHLTVGTHKENMADMAEKGRAKGNGKKRLKKKQIYDILLNESKLTVAELAKKYKVKPRTIQSIRNKDKRAKTTEG